MEKPAPDKNLLHSVPIKGSALHNIHHAKANQISVHEGKREADHTCNARFNVYQGKESMQLQGNFCHWDSL